MSKRTPAWEYLRGIPLFEECSDDELERIDTLTTMVSVPAGKTLLHQGEQGFEFGIIRDGEVAVRHDGIEVARLGAGSFLGEHALLGGDARTADVVALTPLYVLVFDLGQFRRLVREFPAVAERLRFSDEIRVERLDRLARS